MRRCAEGELRGRIVETESYLGGEDKASHSAGGKRTERNTAMFMKPGTIYVYPIYGIYLCMNVSSEGKKKKKKYLMLPEGKHLLRVFLLNNIKATEDYKEGGKKDRKQHKNLVD